MNPRNMQCTDVAELSRSFALVGFNSMQLEKALGVWMSSGFRNRAQVSSTVAVGPYNPLYGVIISRPVPPFILVGFLKNSRRNRPQHPHRYAPLEPHSPRSLRALSNRNERLVGNSEQIPGVQTEG